MPNKILQIFPIIAYEKGIIGLSWWQYVSSDEESSEALIAENVYFVKTSISGTVVEVAAKDNQVVSPHTAMNRELSSKFNEQVKL